MAIGIAQSALSQIEGDKTAPRKATLQQIAQTLENDLGEIWLRRFLDERPINHLQNVLDRVISLIGDNEYIMMRFVVALAEKVEAFGRLIEPKTLADLQAKNSQLQQMMELMKKGDDRWGDLLEPLGFLEGLDEEEDVIIEPAEMMIAPVVARIGPGKDSKKTVEPLPTIDDVRRNFVSQEGIDEIKRRVKPRKRKSA